MKDHLFKLIRQKGLRLSLLFSAIIICANVILVIYYRSVVIRSSDVRQHIQVVRDGINNLSSNVWLGDLGVRAYLIKQTDELLNPYIQARDSYEENLNELENNLLEIGFDIGSMKPAKLAISNYMETLRLMVDLCDASRVDDALEIFYEDRGYIAWQQYAPFIESANSYIDELNLRSEKEYQDAVNLILLIQIVLIVILLPILIIAQRKLFKDSQFRSRIFNLIDSGNREYLYDDGDEETEKNEDLITKHLVDNLKKAVNFINNITKGNYEIEWEGLNESKSGFNKNNIAGELTMMRDQMQKAKRLDEIRIWTNEGLSNFADLIRKHQNNLDLLSEVLVSNIVQYLGAQQGGLFFADEDDKNQQYLKLMGCYAYQRKKFVEKRIEIGQGMVGQCFLEGETTHITNIPEEYVHITSGLGDTKPTTLLIVPMKMNEEVVGVIEIAGLKPFEKHKIEFLEKLAETIASSISSVKINESTQALLEQSQQQAEEMRAQEEEMRQNMEELQATQEQMHRKNEEVEKLLKVASENEESMKINMEALEELQQETDRKSQEILEEKEKLEAGEAILSTLMEISPDRVTIKDKSGKYLMLSKSKYKSLKEKGFTDIIGKSDKEIFGEEHYEKSFGSEKKIMTNQKTIFNVKEQIEISEGVKIWGLTTRAPLKDKNGEVHGLVVVTRDVTKETELEDELNSIKNKS